MGTSGDNAGYLARSYEAMSDMGCDVTHLQLFTQPNLPVREQILKSDVIWVGGGSARVLSVGIKVAQQIPSGPNFER